jgi:hypothetical protein
MRVFMIQSSIEEQKVVLMKNIMLLVFARKPIQEARILELADKGGSINLDITEGGDGFAISTRPEINLTS